MKAIALLRSWKLTAIAIVPMAVSACAPAVTAHRFSSNEAGKVLSSTNDDHTLIGFLPKADLDQPTLCADKAEQTGSAGDVYGAVLCDKDKAVSYAYVIDSASNAAFQPRAGIDNHLIRVAKEEAAPPAVEVSEP